MLATVMRVRGVAIRSSGVRHRVPLFSPAENGEHFAGLLLLLQLALIYFVNALSWAGGR